MFEFADDIKLTDAACLLNDKHSKVSWNIKVIELGRNSKSLMYESLMGNGSLAKSSSEEYLQPTVDHSVSTSEQYHADVKKNKYTETLN